MYKNLVSIVAAKKSIIACSERLCSLNYPACNARAQHYVVICGLFGLTIFFILSHKRHDFWEQAVERKMCVLILSKTSV
jgi:hypothetical protein